MANPLLTGVTGLTVHQKMIEVIGNNIANLNTTAYKTRRVSFSDVFYETVRPSTGGVIGQIGGTNAAQIGTGAKVATISVDNRQGNVETTGGALDFAIEGDGFFTLDSGQGPVYSRSGIFSIDKNGTLVDASTGYRVQRFGTVGEPDGVNPAFQTSGSSEIRIPLGTTVPGNPTTEATVSGNLSAGNARATYHTFSTSTRLLEGTAAATEASLLNNLNWVSTPFQAGDTLSISGVDADGTAISTNVAVDGTTTVGDLLAAINGAYGGAEATLDADGYLKLTADEPGTSTLTFALGNGSGNVGELDTAGNPLLVATAGATGTTVHGGLEVYDSRGTAHVIGLSFEPQPDGTWNMQANLDPAQGEVLQGTIAGLTFASNGSFTGISSTSLSSLVFRFVGQTEPQTVELSFSGEGSLGGLKSISGESSVSVEQDGYPPGTLSAVSVDGSGLVDGIATNGRRFPLAQLAIASFRNPAGLESRGNAYLIETRSSGEVQIGSGQSAGRGTVRSGQLEQSNVDLAAEFTRLIIAQRGFSANARTITVSNEVLEELAQILR
jgi:flagellar hook protein FlgE